MQLVGQLLMQFNSVYLLRQAQRAFAVTHDLAFSLHRVQALIKVVTLRIANIQQSVNLLNTQGHALIG